MNGPERGQERMPRDANRGLATVAFALLRYQNLIKIYHWQTPSYARHKASDELFETLSSLTDKLVEGLQGASGQRVFFGRPVQLTLDDVNDQDAVELVTEFKDWLQVLQRQVELDKGLSNIRDEIISALDKALYLFTFQ
jgi:hypothetical protein